MRRLAVAFTSLLTLAAMLMAGPYDDTYDAYKLITVSPTATGGDLASQSDFPLLVRLRKTSSARGEEALTGSLNSGLDIRFTSEDGMTPLAYEREFWSADSAEFWVRIPTMNGTTGGGTAVDTKIRMYYGNATAIDSSSSSAVFDTAAGFRAVYHMSAPNATDDELDATQNGFTATVFGAPTSAFGGIGRSRTLSLATAVGADSASFIIGGSQSNFDLYMSDANNGLAVGMSGLVRKTTDGGANWETRKSGALLAVAPGSNVKQIALKGVACAPNNANICYAVGGGVQFDSSHATRYIARSTDGGATWANNDSGGSSQTYFGVSCNSSSSCVAVGGNTTTTRYYATLNTEGGAWTTNSGTAIRLQGVHCIPGGTECFAVGGSSKTSAGINKFTNSGGTWGVASQTVTGAHRLNGVHCIDANNCIAVGGGGLIFTTNDGGATAWTSRTSPTTKHLRGVSCNATGTACIAVGGALPNTAGDVSTILKSIDSGVTWTSKSPVAFSDSLFSVKFANATNAVIVGANGTVFRSTDAGETWTLNANSRKLAPGTSGYYDFATAGSGTGKGDNYSISVWANVTATTGGQQTLFAKGEHYWNVQSTSGGAWNFAERGYRTGTGGSTFNTPPTGNTTLHNADGAALATGWRYVTAQRTNSANAETLFVDGGTRCGGSQTAVTSTYENTTNLSEARQGYMGAVAIGRRTDLFGRFWKRGPVDEVRFEGAFRGSSWACLSFQTQTPNLTNYYNKVAMGTPVSLSPSARNGSNVFQFSGAGQYSFAIPAGMAESAELRIVDVVGRVVWSSSVRMNGKAQTITWNGVASNGSRVTSGVYFARLKTLNQGKSREFALKASLTH